MINIHTGILKINSDLIVSPYYKFEDLKKHLILQDKTV